MRGGGGGPEAGGPVDVGAALDRALGLLRASEVAQRSRLRLVHSRPTWFSRSRDRWSGGWEVGVWYPGGGGTSAHLYLDEDGGVWRGVPGQPGGRGGRRRQWATLERPYDPGDEPVHLLRGLARLMSELDIPW